MNDKKVENRPTLGFALGGGGARGLAHIGVLKVLEVEGIPIDYLSGTSMGGLVAALFASGWSPSEIEREFIRMSRASKLVRLIDLTPPRRGLLEGSRVRAYLASLIGGDRTFEDLPIPLALVAVDLNSGREIILREGSLLEAVLATIAVPGLFPPVFIGDQALADGGLLDNVPTGVLREMGARFTVAVDVSPDLICEEELDGEAPQQAWPSLFPPFARDFYRAELIMISSITQERMKQFPPDLLLHPAVPACVSIFWGLKHASLAIAAGEAAAREALPELKRVMCESL